MLTSYMTPYGTTRANELINKELLIPDSIADGLLSQGSIISGAHFTNMIYL